MINVKFSEGGHCVWRDLSRELKETKRATPAEQVTISLSKTGDGGEITIAWGDMELSTGFKAK